MLRLSTNLKSALLLRQNCYFSSQNPNPSPIQAKSGLKYYRPSYKINLISTLMKSNTLWSLNHSFKNQKSFYKWKFYYKNFSVPPNLQQLNESLPVNKNIDFACAQDKIKYIWFGHSSALISIGGKVNILIDPVFSQRCSPFKSIGPKRYRQIPCQIQDFPKIDIVLVSHDHYDHLDSQCLQKLNKLHKPTFVAGLNSRDVFPKNSRLQELDWTETKKIIVISNYSKEQVQITFVPACHWSRRWLFDTGKRLWGGFVIKTSNEKKIYYSGDTGYCDLFKQIYDVFGQIDLSIIPIGVYEPRQFLKNQHLNPQQAVQVHKELKSKKSVGVHWGTFPLSNQRWDAPRTELKSALLKHNLKDTQFLAIGHEQSLEIQNLSQYFEFLILIKLIHGFQKQNQNFLLHFVFYDLNIFSLQQIVKLTQN